jgi:hypothetical protein
MSRGFKIFLLLAGVAVFVLSIAGVLASRDAKLLSANFVILIIAALYFVPVGVSMARNCKSGGGIAVVNIFLGWTFIGWVVALAWAASGEPKPTAIPTEVSIKQT